MRLDLDTRTSVLFIAALVGLGWQVAVWATAGKDAVSEALVTAFVTILLATLGIGLGKNGKNGKNGKGGDGERE